MPGANPQESTNEEMKNLLVEMWLLLPSAARKACHSLDHHPQQMEFDGLVQRIVLLLMQNDFHTLRSFNNRSKPQTWLYTIARRHILHLLEEQKGKLRLEDLPLDFFVFPPSQEEKLLLEEQQKLLLAAASQLTAHEQKLFFMMMQGLKPEEIAKEMKVKKASVYKEKNALIKKLRRIANDR